MANRSYASLKEFKDSLGITASSDDVTILKTLEGATLTIEKYCQRRFQPEHGTKYFTGANRIWVKPDLLSISTLKTDEDGDGTFENTFTTSDYVLFDLNEYPKTYIEISDNSSYGTFGMGSKKGVEIVGEWGYGDGESATPYTEQSKTVSAMAVSASTQTVVSTNLAIGQTWRIDSEDFYCTDLTGSIAKIIPSINGTSATSHVASSTIYVYDYPSDIKQACLDLAGAMWNTRGKKGTRSESIGDYSYTLNSYSDKDFVKSIIGDSIDGYRRVKA